MKTSGDLSLSVCGYASARADLATIATLRKAIPAWAPKDTPGHFLKHADEQTVVAVAALDNAINSRGRPIDDYRQWAIIAAPRFIGRMAGAAAFHRYSRGGGPTISPHLIPQHSLHSVSGAMSILLATHQPNFGIGGTSQSLAEGLLGALTFPQASCKGTWLLATGWDPEPQPDGTGNSAGEPVCYAAALALTTAATHESCGTLRLMPAGNSNVGTLRCRWEEHAGGLAHALVLASASATSCSFAWRLPFVGNIVLEVRSTAAQLPLAA